MTLRTTLLLAGMLLTTVASADADVFVSTEQLGYVGSWTRYGSLADAQSGTNPISSGAVPQRDLALYFTSNVPDVYTDANIALTRWYSPSSMNPNNTNFGFLQLYDIDGSTDTSIEGAWTDGTLSSFQFSVTGTNADNPNDVARFGEMNGGGAATTAGTFHEYALEVTFGGLTGTFNPMTGRFESNGGFSTVGGTFTGIFENMGTDASRHGFYAVDVDINLISWAVDNGYTSGSDTYFYSTVVNPEPASLALWSLIGFIFGGFRLSKSWRTA